MFNSSLGQAKLESLKNHELARGYLLVLELEKHNHPDSRQLQPPHHENDERAVHQQKSRHGIVGNNRDVTSTGKAHPNRVSGVDGF